MKPPGGIAYNLMRWAKDLLYPDGSTIVSQANQARLGLVNETSRRLGWGATGVGEPYDFHYPKPAQTDRLGFIGASIMWLGQDRMRATISDYRTPDGHRVEMSAKPIPLQGIDALLENATTYGEWAARNQLDVVTIAIGGNDMLEGRPPQEIRASLKDAITKIHALSPGTKIVMIGLTQEGTKQIVERFGADEKTLQTNLAYTASIERMYGELAQELRSTMGAQFYYKPEYLRPLEWPEHYLWGGGLPLRDGAKQSAMRTVETLNGYTHSDEAGRTTNTIHPNPEGINRLVDNVMQYLDAHPFTDLAKGRKALKEARALVARPDAELTALNNVIQYLEDAPEEPSPGNHKVCPGSQASALGCH